ncbi:MAG: tetraacyldisaccharide 4'-kinase [Gammaproteobacteria bacterium]|nr:tetraacyldisaccharide 4'-kinase [Gammaproteobacteria bacterium]MDX2486072.1 tetraacyldisaccharide 4'-kinase [Gammaproteobacteria bacterium]
MSFSIWLQSQWQKKGIYAWLMLPLSLLYCVIMSLRREAYESGLLKTHRIARPVIVVGNLSVGGTGKTPLVIWIANQLARKGMRPAVISRGYGGRATNFPLLVQADSPAALAGDEPVMIARNLGCPVVIDPDRVAAANWLVERNLCDVIISDDGLQHLALGRDLELAVITSDRIAGNGFCLPAGPLREGAGRLKSIDVVISRKQNSALTPHFMNLLSGECARLDNPAMRLPLSAFWKSPVHAVAGIGNPEGFFSSLRVAGLEVIPHPFPDHYDYSPADLSFPDGLPVLMTEKDAVKCKEFVNRHCWAVTVSVEVDEGILEIVMNKIMEINANG